MNPFQAFLHLLSDPNIAFILFTIGFYGLLFELQNPNFVTGILGAIAIILAFIGFGSLPLNVAGLLLIVPRRDPVRARADRDQPRPARRGRHRLLRAGRVGALHRARRPVRTARPRRDAGRRRPRRVTAAVLLLLIVAFAVRTRAMPAPAGLVGSASSLARRRHRRRPSIARAARLGLSSPARSGPRAPRRPAAGAWHSGPRRRDGRV